MAGDISGGYNMLKNSMYIVNKNVKVSQCASSFNNILLLMIIHVGKGCLCMCSKVPLVAKLYQNYTTNFQVIQNSWILLGGTLYVLININTLPVAVKNI